MGEESLSQIVTEISEVIDDDDDDDYFYDDAYKKEVDDMFGASQTDIGPTPTLDKARNGDHKDYGVYGKGDEYVGNETSEVNFESMKADLISSVMELYDADKARFIQQHEAEKADILKELQKVQEENEKVQEENLKLKAAFNSFINSES